MPSGISNKMLLCCKKNVAQRSKKQEQPSLRRRNTPSDSRFRWY